MTLRTSIPEGVEFDLCVVGSGPAGLAVALSAAGAGLRVIVIESGGARDAAPTDLSSAEIVDPRRHAPMDVAVRRGLGGTSAAWGGRAVPLDPVDFARAFPGEAASWPLSYAEMERWHSPAARFLGLDAAGFTPPGAAGEAEAVQTTLEQWCPQRDMARRHAARIASADGPDVVLGASLVDIEIDAERGAVARLIVVVAGERKTLRARACVLACGGLETTRLLLVVQRRHPRLFGGAGGPLGRFYMGHLTGMIAGLVLARRSDVEALDFYLGETGAYARRRWSLSQAIQLERRILNCAFWLDNPFFYNAQHESGLMSLVFLALSVGPLGRRLVRDYVRNGVVGDAAPDYRGHLANVAAAPVATMRGALRVLADRYFSQPPKPGFLFRDPAGRYGLRYHAEQSPSADSRVELGESCDALGLPRLHIDLRVKEDDARSVLRAHDAVASAFAASGYARIEHWHPPERRIDAILAQASDGFHQLGTTRMSASPRDGVVDVDLRVHDIANLYVASSSVFPTAGQANPTFPTVALSLRLADHLAAMLGRRAASPLAAAVL